MNETRSKEYHFVYASLSVPGDINNKEDNLLDTCRFKIEFTFSMDLPLDDNDKLLFTQIFIDKTKKRLMVVTDRKEVVILKRKKKEQQANNSKKKKEESTYDIKAEWENPVKVENFPDIL